MQEQQQAATTAHSPVGNALEIAALSVNYRAGSSLVHALDRVDLTVPAGHRMAVVGESGSGKTTLGLAVMGLLPQNSEFDYRRLSVGGVDVDLRDAKQMRSLRGNRVSMVFQDAKAALDPVRTIGSQLNEPLRVHRIVDRSSATPRSSDCWAPSRSDGRRRWPGSTLTSCRAACANGR